MSQLQYFREMFSYNHWANQQALGALTRSGQPERGRRLLGHIVGAEWVWLARLRRNAATMAVWPELSLEECEWEIGRLGPAWQDYLAQFSKDDLLESVPYANSKGEKFSNTRLEILTHVTLHGGYHRGQIAALLRSSGAEPAYTDYIEWARRGRLTRK